MRRRRQQVLWFGSANFNRRSARGDDELIVVSTDARDVTAFAHQFPVLLRHARPLR